MKLKYQKYFLTIIFDYYNFDLLQLQRLIKENDEKDGRRRRINGRRPAPKNE
mgnify:CR=1 FL=1